MLINTKQRDRGDRQSKNDSDDQTRLFKNQGIGAKISLLVLGEIDPNLAANVVFMTGDTVSVDIKDDLDKSGNVYLVKPFNLHELRETLHKVMKTIEN